MDSRPREPAMPCARTRPSSIIHFHHPSDRSRAMHMLKRLCTRMLPAILALPLTVHTSHAGPSAKFAFSTSDLTLIEETTGTAGWVTILSAPIKTPAAKELYINASLEAGLYTQTLVKSKNNKKDTSTA